VAPGTELNQRLIQSCLQAFGPGDRRDRDLPPAGQRLPEHFLTPTMLDVLEQLPMALHVLAEQEHQEGQARCGGGGVLLLDGPQSVLVARNSFVGIGAATIYQCLWANTDTVTIEGNTWNFQQRMVCNPAAIGGVQQIAYPDMLDGFMITAAAAPVQSMVSLRQKATAGQITLVRSSPRLQPIATPSPRKLHDANKGHVRSLGSCVPTSNFNELRLLFSRYSLFV